MTSDLEEASFADRQDFLAVQRAMGLGGGASFSQEESRGPFSEFGSFQKIWVNGNQYRAFPGWVFAGMAAFAKYSRVLPSL